MAGGELQVNGGRGERRGEASSRAVDVTFHAHFSAQPSSQIKSFQLVCHLQIMWLPAGCCATSLAGEKLEVR